MYHFCDACPAVQIVASRKMLVLFSEPSITIWICELCAKIYENKEGIFIADEDTIERMWVEEEVYRDRMLEMEENLRESGFVAADDPHLHWCPCCRKEYDCADLECYSIAQVECDSCIMHENICYSRSSNPST